MQFLYNDVYRRVETGPLITTEEGTNVIDKLNSNKAAEPESI